MPEQEISSEPCIVVITSNDSKTELEKISTLLVHEKLAACCQISGPITSRYSWRGKIETSEEWRCEIKTTESLSTSVEDAIKKHHHYGEPEIIKFRIEGGSNGYLDWIRESVRNPGSSS